MAAEEVERWLPVVGFDGYDVSNLGRVRSWRPRGRERGRRSVPHLLHPSVNRGGYRCVHQSAGTAKGLVHRLVLEAFVGPCPPGMQACHNDGDPGNNRLDNLRWDTPKGNMADRARHGRTADQRGSLGPNAKLTDDDVRAVRARLARGEMARAVARDLGMSEAAISKIANRRTYANV